MKTTLVQALSLVVAFVLLSGSEISLAEGHASAGGSNFSGHGGTHRPVAKKSKRHRGKRKKSRNANRPFMVMMPPVSASPIPFSAMGATNPFMNGSMGASLTIVEEEPPRRRRRPSSDLDRTISPPANWAIGSLMNGPAFPFMNQSINPSMGTLFTGTAGIPTPLMNQAINPSMDTSLAGATGIPAPLPAGSLY